MSLPQRAREVAGLARSHALSDPSLRMMIELLCDVVEDLATAEQERREQESKP